MSLCVENHCENTLVIVDVDVAVIMGDLARLASYLMIITSIILRKSCEGWSGRMQILLFLVFLTRYWNVLNIYGNVYHPLTGLWWIILSMYTMYLIYIRHRSSLDKRSDTFWIESIILGSLAVAFILCDDDNSPDEIFWLFSHFVESLAILPQYYYIYHKGKKDSNVTYYIIILVYYRLFYIGHWIDIYFNTGKVDEFIVYPGVIQLFSYVVYFLFPKGKEETRSDLSGETPPLRILPKYLTQESLLETPLLKKSATASSSIYTIGCESTYSTLSRSGRSTGSGSSTVPSSFSIEPQNEEGRY